MKRFLCIMAFWAASFLTIVPRASARPIPHLEPPYVAIDAPGFNRCERGAPCPGRVMLVKNPQRDPIVVVVWCMLDPRTETAVEISARGQATVDIGTDKPGGLKAGDCAIARWRR